MSSLFMPLHKLLQILLVTQCLTGREISLKKRNIKKKNRRGYVYLSARVVLTLFILLVISGCVQLTQRQLLCDILKLENHTF